MPKWGSDDDEIPRRDKEMSDDRAEVKKVESIGKKACWGGIGVSVLGGVISAIGIGKDTGHTKFQNWFCASMGLWVLILISQAVCLWEVSDRLGRHNDKLVKRCKWFYLAVTIFAIALLSLLLSIWVFDGSFVDPKLNQTSNWVLLVIDSFLLVLGTTASLFVYFRYATNIKYTDSHTAKPLQPLRRTLSEAASKKGRSIKRTLSDRTHRSKSSTCSKTTQEIAYSPPSSSSGDDLPQFPEYDRKKSMESGQTVSRPVSPLPDRQGSQSRRSVDTYFDERGPPYPDSDSSDIDRNSSRASTRAASSRPPSKATFPPSAQIQKPIRKPVPSAIPYVPRTPTPDFASSDDGSIDSSDELFLPRSTNSTQSPRNSSQSQSNPFSTPRNSFSSTAPYQDTPIWPPPNPYSRSNSRPTSPASSYRAYNPTTPTASPPPSRPASSSSSLLARSSTRKSANYPPGTARRNDRNSLPSQSGGDSSSGTDESVRSIRKLPYRKGSLTVSNPDLT